MNGNLMGVTDMLINDCISIVSAMWGMYPVVWMHKGEYISHGCIQEASSGSQDALSLEVPVSISQNDGKGKSILSRQHDYNVWKHESIECHRVNKEFLMDLVLFFNLSF